MNDLSRRTLRGVFFLYSKNDSTSVSPRRKASVLVPRCPWFNVPYVIVDLGAAG